jgi:hypothetical protein
MGHHCLLNNFFLDRSTSQVLFLNTLFQVPDGKKEKRIMKKKLFDKKKKENLMWKTPS